MTTARKLTYAEKIAVRITRKQSPGSNVYIDQGHIIPDLKGSIKDATDPLAIKTLKKRLAMLYRRGQKHKRFEDYCAEMVIAINRTPGRSAFIVGKNGEIWVEDATPPKNLLVVDFGNAAVIRRFHGKYSKG